MTTLAARSPRPPGPPPRWFGLPLLRAMARDYTGFTQSLQRQYGDVVHMRLGVEQAYDLFDPDDVRTVLVEQARHFIRWQRGTEVFAESMGQSVLTTEGAAWQRQRRLLQPGFAPRRMAGYARLMVAATHDGLQRLPDEAAFEVDIGHLMTQLTMDVIQRTLFSSAASDEAQDAERAVRVLSAVGMREMFWPMTLPDWLPLPGKAAKRWALRRLDAIVQGHLRRRVPGQGHDDLLEMMLTARDDDGGQLSATEVRDQCMTIFQAGHETSATALLWWAWAMAAHPDAAARAHEEVDRVLDGRAPTLADIAALRWLTQSIQESMRLFPPAAGLMTRRALQPVALRTCTVPAGAMVRITPWVLHHDPRWFPDPERFDPARFDAAAPPLPRGAYLPFGTGPRVCLGQHFAMTEMVLIAAMLLQRFGFAPLADRTPPPAQVQVTLRPVAPLRLRLIRR